MKRFFVALIFAVLPVTFIFAEYNRFNIPDATEIRRELVDTWFTEPLELIRTRNPEVRTNLVGQRFQVRCEEHENDFSIIVSPETEMPVYVYTDTDQYTTISIEYPVDISGSWVLVRNKSDGKPLFIRYYFSADSDIYAQISPAGNVTLADMVIFSSYPARGVQLGTPFESFYTASFEQFYKWTSSVLPWNYVTVMTDMYHSNLQMINVIRTSLDKITFVNDAIYDESGDPIYLSTGKTRTIEEKDAGKLSLSNAGFVKWVVDGLIYPVTGSYTLREPLIVPTAEYKSTGMQGIMDTKVDLFFALNWTRNLAAASLSVNANKTYLYSDSGVDVKTEPFSAEIINGKITNTTGYIKNTGYSIEKLRSLLYVFAVSQPSYCYLAAIRSTAKSPVGEFHPFNYCSVVIPYIDSNGKFDCVVFENGKELTLAKFMQRYKNDFVHLVRVQTNDRFFPQMPDSQ